MSLLVILSLWFFFFFTSTKDGFVFLKKKFIKKTLKILFRDHQMLHVACLLGVVEVCFGLIC